RLTQRNLEHATSDASFAIQRRGELEREWDLDRAIMLAFAAMGGIALALGLRRNWRWRFPLAAQIAFLSAHAVAGWRPPAAGLRRFGFRTRQEIDTERVALGQGTKSKL